MPLYMYIQVTLQDHRSEICCFETNYQQQQQRFTISPISVCYESIAECWTGILKAPWTIYCKQNSGQLQPL